ncbi:hypothetical protein BCR42DRAFT_409153 [Absidia repens]|uniref:C2H2-type domain-containing protein n=1 Tax=Absidia repens TaxID=90262 RepID=A0A1X2IQS0_9FUNG|nr:hypothetical protein BCR42DRAFT_409153 [Absidia repens]
MSSIYPQHYHDQRGMMISLPLSPPSHGHDSIINHHDTKPDTTTFSSPSSTSSPPPSYYLTNGDSSSNNTFAVNHPPLPLPTFTSVNHHVSTLLNSTTTDHHPDTQVFYPTTSSAHPAMMISMDTHTYPQQQHAPSSPSQRQLGRPYPCRVCFRAFSRKHDLQRHHRVHTGAKPYLCPSCKKAFARTDALKRHLRMEDKCRLSSEIQALKETGKRLYRNL